MIWHLHNNFSTINFSYIACISQTSTIIDYKPVSDKTNKKLKSEIVDTETVSEHKCSSTSIMESSSKDTKDLLYGDIILVEKMGDIPRNTLTHSIGISNKNLRWEYTRFCNAWYVQHSCNVG